MNFLRPTRFSRRSLLAGLGAGAALVPLLHSTRSYGEAPAFPRRLITIVWPNGVMPEQFWPTGELDDWTIDPGENSPLAPLIPHKQDIIVVGGLEFTNFLELGQGGGHAALPFMFTGVPGAKFDGKISDGLDLTAGGPSVDQFIAGELAKTHALPFHSLVLQSTQLSGDDHYVSFSGAPLGGKPNAPTPEYDPVRLFDDLFASGLIDPEKAKKIRAERQSILDHVGDGLTRMSQRVGTEDRQKLEAHLAAVRDVEKQLAELSDTCVLPPRPADDIDYTTEVANPNIPLIHQLQMDMTVAAMACDMTRVSSILWGNSHNNHYTFFWLGDEFTDPGEEMENAGFDGPYRHHHEIAHNAHVDDKHRAMKNKVDQWFFSQLAYLIQKLKDTPEGDGSMLDNTVILFANNMEVGAAHSTRDLPWVLAGGGGGHFKTGRFVRWASGEPDKTIPQNILLTSLCRAMELDVETFGDPKYGTGELEILRG